MREAPMDESSRKLLRSDLAILAFVAAAAALAGYFFNRLRPTPLPVIYQSREARMAEAAERLRASAPPATTTGEIEDIRLERMDELVKEGGTPILDARAAVFFGQGHIPGAINVSREDFEADYARHRASLERDKSRPVVVYCADTSCQDSGLVAEALVRLGFAKVLLFKGGWHEWTHAGRGEER